MLRTTAALAASTVALALAPIASMAAPATTARAAAAPLVVSAGGARVVVERSPFRLSITDGTGKTVLREVAHPATDSIAEPVTADPSDGHDNQHTTTLYAPLSFLVGTETLTQEPDQEWIANLRNGTRSGTWYSAQSVEQVAHDGRDLVLTLGTNDPSGRKLTVRIGTQGKYAVRVRAQAVPATGVAMIGDSFQAAAGAHRDGFFGFGGRHDHLDQRGRVLSSFVNQESLSLTDTSQRAAQPDDLDMFPNGSAAAYYPQAMFYTTRYGFLLAQPELARFKLAADRADAWNVAASTSRLDYVVAPGDPRRSVRTLTALNGRHIAPPQWALGTMFDRLVLNDGETYAHYEANLRADLRNIDKYDLPLTAYRIEGWGFPDSTDNHGLALHSWVHAQPQAAMIKALRARGIHPLAYLRPWLEPDSAPVQAGYAVTTAGGQPYYVTGSSGRRFGLVDFTNPQAVAWWQQQVRAVLALGFDGFMQDYGEQVLFDMHFADGTTGYDRHNSYLTLYTKVTRQAVNAFHRDHPKRQPWVFTRAGYTGLPGSTAYENANFPGDETTDWGHASGLRSLTTDMLSRAVGGAYGFATDIGGYFDYTTPPTSKELFLRWAEWAALSPVFRLHGSGHTGTHAPWTYDAQTVRAYTEMSKLHLRARPLLARLWAEADRTGAPPTRPLWWQDPSDRAGWHQDQEWLLGPDVLVAPVVRGGATSRRVYLPQGCWRLHGAGRRLTGKHTVTVKAGLTELPWFTRCGTTPLG